VSYLSKAMPKKVPPASEFANRLYRLRIERGLTQMELAAAIGSSQRALSRYETVAEFPPASVIVDLAKALRVSADELLGLKAAKPAKQDAPEERRLWKKFRQVLDLSEKDRRAIIRMINSLSAAKPGKAA
jgi:transcriptional regulator with XRE-family HTH domain